MTQLVVNADDLGMTHGINRAAAEAHRRGIVTSTSVMANGAAFDDAVEVLRRNPELGVGLHVNLTQGRPLGGAKSPLADIHGNFYPLRAMALRLSLGLVAARDLEEEISAQAQRLMRAGARIDHIDSHQNLHLHPRLAVIVAAVARRIDVRWIRFNHQRPILPWPLREAGLLRLGDHLRHGIAALGARRLSGADTGGKRRWIVGAPLLDVSPRDLLGAIVQSAGPGVTEWVCHPAYMDGDLRALLGDWSAPRREAELKLLLDPVSRERLAAAGIELVNYAQLEG